MMKSIARGLAVVALTMPLSGFAQTPPAPDPAGNPTPAATDKKSHSLKAAKPKKGEKKPADSGPGDPSGRPNTVSREDTKK